MLVVVVVVVVVADLADVVLFLWLLVKQLVFPSRVSDRKRPFAAVAVAASV